MQLFKNRKNYQAANCIKKLEKSDKIIACPYCYESLHRQDENNIKKIQFSTSGCFGECPVFNLDLNKNDVSKFHAEWYNFKKSKNIKFKKEDKKFKTIISKIDFQQIEDILNYINFSELSKDYSVNWTDDQTSTLTIIYDDGKIKSIRDYGLVGTYGLKLLYKKLFDLRFNQNWKKMK